VGDKTFEHVLTYNKMLEWCDRDLDKDDMHRIDAILDHKKNPKAAGGYKIKVKWKMAIRKSDRSIDRSEQQTTRTTGVP
jgi:hypothetical protein